MIEYIKKKKRKKGATLTPSPGKLLVQMALLFTDLFLSSVTQ